MSYETIRFEREGNLGIIRLYRPERMNAVIEEMYLELQDILEKTILDKDIRCLILTGSVREKDGIKKQAFCAGADLKKHDSGERTRAQKRAYIQLAHETTRQIYEFPKPIIAAINGPARGAGSEMALNCDFVLMAEEASIGFPEIGLGTFIGGGVTRHLAGLIGLGKAKELIYTGKIIDGPNAVETGLALGCFPVNSLMDEAEKLAATLAEKAPVSMGLAKKRMQEASMLDLQTVLDLETDAILSCMDTEDWHEGVRAFNEKRKPVYKGE